MKKKRVLMYDMAISICGLILLGSGLTLVGRLIGDRQNESRLESLADLANGEAGAPAYQGSMEATRPGQAFQGQDSAVDQRLLRLPGYRKLKEKNQDMAGWITIPGTKVDYPVMQSLDRPNYYLNHDFDKKKSIYGTPYVAESCDLGGGCQNVIIYGHHMKNGSMFAALMGYVDKAFYESHPRFWFDTMDQVGEYQVVGVLKASAATEGKLFQLAGAEGQEQYEAFVKEVKARSFYDTGQDATYGESLATLITCEYTLEEGRLVVVAKRIEGGRRQAGG